jgi:hypothetical protein
MFLYPMGVPVLSYALCFLFMFVVGGAGGYDNPALQRESPPPDTENHPAPPPYSALGDPYENELHPHTQRWGTRTKTSSIPILSAGGPVRKRAPPPYSALGDPYENELQCDQYRLVCKKKRLDYKLFFFVCL